MMERCTSVWNHRGLQSSAGGETSMKKLMILGAVAGAIALFIFARQSSAKESDDAEIRAMSAAMIKAFAAKDLDHALAPYVQDETLFVFDAIPPRQFVGIKAWRSTNKGCVALCDGARFAALRALMVTTGRHISRTRTIQ